MSWLKINDSLSALKGQITNFAQEVLAEEEDDQLKKLNDANEKIEELTILCTTQSTEISTLRRQINEFQHNKISEPIPQSKHDNNAGIEDSWFWESENNTSSSSSKNDAEIVSKSGSGGDLTLIPLDNPVTDSEIVQKLQKSLSGIEYKLEKVLIENAVLNEDLTQRISENRELNSNLDELDKQHNAAIENLLDMKKEMQVKYNQLKLNHEKNIEETELKDNLISEVKQRHDEMNKLYQNGIKEIILLNKQTDKMKEEIEKLFSSNDKLTITVETNEEVINKLERENISLLQKETETKNSNEILETTNLELENKLKLLRTDQEKMELNIILLSKTKVDEDKYIEELLEKESKIIELQNFIEKLIDSERSLQKQIIDLQSNLNNKSTESKENSLRLSDIKILLYDYINYESNIDDEKKYIEEFIKNVRDTKSKMKAVENKLITSSKAINELNDEKDKLQHEKETLRADLMHYEIECSDLMKNNELLLTEIDNLKCGKLETIHENNEDSIVILEQQLEDCSNLNRSLEDEYLEVQQKLEESEAEKEKLASKLNLFEVEIVMKTNKCKELQDQIDIMENEKCNLTFEINELKTDDFKVANEAKLKEYKNKIKNLEEQLKTLNLDHSELLIKLNSGQNISIETKNKISSTIMAQEKNLSDKENELFKKEMESDKLTMSLKNLELNNLKHFELSDANKHNEEINVLKTILKETEIKNGQLINELHAFKQKFKELEENNQENSQKEHHINDYQMCRQKLEVLSKEKNDLITLITTKHNESLQYHAEVQRLNQVIHTEVEKTRNLHEEIQKLKLSVITDSNEVERMMDQITFLREKSDILTKNLLTEQTNQKMLNQDKQELLEQKNNLEKKLERLREHLIEVEEAHTQETVELQKKIDETKSKFISLEDDARKSNNAYTSASIRSNQQTETLQTQYMLLQQQRDEFASKLSLAEDRESKNQAALTNLQCALEQFQKDKDRDVDAITHRIRRELNEEKAKVHELSKEISYLQHQIIEAKNGLLAASRISDQLEMSQITISTLKHELMKSQDKFIALTNKLHDAESNQADKVEKTLIKNLLIGYIVTCNNSDKSQILRLISSVLDFNQIESDRVGLNKSQNSWMNSIALGGTTSSADYNKESLAQAFVKFLEKESQPRIKSSDMPTLLNLVRRPSTVSNPVSSFTDDQTQTNAPQLAVQPMLLHDSVLTNFVPSRNSSSILKDILNDS